MESSPPYSEVLRYYRKGKVRSEDTHPRDVEADVSLTVLRLWLSLRDTEVCERDSSEHALECTKWSTMSVP